MFCNDCNVFSNVSHKMFWTDSAKEWGQAHVDHAVALAVALVVQAFQAVLALGSTAVQTDSMAAGHETCVIHLSHDDYRILMDITGSN